MPELRWTLLILGALFIAGAAGFADTRKLFNQLLAWGMAMTVVGAVLCFVLFG